MIGTVVDGFDVMKCPATGPASTWQVSWQMMWCERPA